MNIEHMRELRERVRRALWWECDMSLWRCDTVGCFGGHTEMLMREKGLSATSKEELADWLGLTAEESCILFFSYPIHEVNWKEWMLHRLDDVIETGQVNPLSLDRLGWFAEPVQVVANPVKTNRQQTGNTEVEDLVTP